MHHYFPGLFFGGFFLTFLVMFIALHILLFIIPMFMILKKMGYSGWWVLLNYVPFGTIIGLWILATANWPVEGRSAT